MASRKPYSRFVGGVYGKKPDLLAARIGSQAQYDFFSFADFDACRAFSLMAFRPRPGGSISPFWEHPTVTSTPHASWR